MSNMNTADNSPLVLLKLFPFHILNKTVYNKMNFWEVGNIGYLFLVMHATLKQLYATYSLRLS